MNPKFKFEEMIEVVCQKCQAYGKKGLITGSSRGDDGTWFYTISSTTGEGTYFVAENQIKTTGFFGDHEQLMSGKNIRVNVTKKGKGYIVNS